VGDITVVLVIAVFRGPLERQFTVALEIQIARRVILARRPRLVTLPLVRGGLKSRRLGQIERPFAFQVVSKKRGLNLFAVIFAGVVVELNFAELVAAAGRPAA